MPLETECRQCGTRLRVQDEHRGKTVKCPACSTIVADEGLREEPTRHSPFVAADESLDRNQDENPYASPTSQAPEATAGNGPADTLDASEGIRVALGQTRPWVLLLAVLGFLAAGLTALGAVGLLVGAALSGDGVDTVVAGIVAVMYLAFAVVYCAGACYLYAYGQRIATFLGSNGLGDLESAMAAQKSFWKLAGVAILAMFVIGLICTIGVFFLASFAASV